MTTNNNQPANASILPVERRLPPPDENATVLVRLVTIQLNPAEIEKAKDGKSKEPVMDQTVWILNGAHPLAGSKIVRMYRVEDGVEVYSSDGQMTVRTFIPERAICFYDEMMSEDTFVAFIAAAETEEDEEEEEEEEEEVLLPPPPAQGSAPTEPSPPPPPPTTT